jgi:nitrate/nitrite transporter NarK
VPVLLIGVGAAAHQAWSANLFTTVSDHFPRAAVGSVVGIGGMAGGLGSVLITQLAAIYSTIIKHWDTFKRAIPFFSVFVPLRICLPGSS